MLPTALTQARFTPQWPANKFIADLFDASSFDSGLFDAYPEANSTKMIAGLFDAYSLLEIGTYKPSSVVRPDGKAS